MSQPAFIVQEGAREYYVSDGGSDGASWGTYSRRGNEAEQITLSKSLPERETRLDAEVDLLALARRKRWPVTWFGAPAETLATESRPDGSTAEDR